VMREFRKFDELAIPAEELTRPWIQAERVQYTVWS
jgi:hypothetical protein